MEVEELRADLIEAHGLRNVDDVYSFFYDETNNVRKFHIVDDGFNVNDPGNFVLAGILHKGVSNSADFGSLISDLRLQKTAKELKLRHIGSGEFEQLMSSDKLSRVLRWLFENEFYIHYFNLNIIYWSFIDIVDSVLAEAMGDLIPHHMRIKSDLYHVLMVDRPAFISGAKKFQFPNVPADSVSEFSEWLSGLAQKNCAILPSGRAALLRHFFASMRNVDELPFLTGEKEGILVGDFSAFYFRSLYVFKNSHHVFDRETNIERSLDSLNLTSAGNPINNCRFADSKDEISIQVSDVIAGLLGKYFTFVRSRNMKYLAATFKNMSAKQRENMALLENIINSSDDLSNGFFNTIASIDESQRHREFLFRAVGT